MCQIKTEIRKKVWNLCTDIGFCIDYYSIGDSWMRCASILRQSFPDSSFEYSNPTEEEWSIINADIIANDLSLPISDITKRKCYKFEGVMFGGVSANIFVNPYFIFVFISGNEGNIAYNKTEEDDVLLSYLKDSTKISIVNVSCNVNCGELVTLDNLNDFVDKEAFPDSNDHLIMNSSYVDTRQYDDCLVNMNRSLRKPKEGSDYELLICVHAEITGDAKDLYDIFGMLLAHSIDEVTRVLK